MTTTKSPVSTWGVKIGFSLPRRRLAALTATRPSTWSLASMIHHLRGTSLALAENVFIRAERARKLRASAGMSTAGAAESTGTAAAYNHYNEPLAFCRRIRPSCRRFHERRERRIRLRLRRRDRAGDEPRPAKPSALRHLHRRAARP